MVYFNFYDEVHKYTQMIGAFHSFLFFNIYILCIAMIVLEKDNRILHGCFLLSCTNYGFLCVCNSTEEGARDLRRHTVIQSSGLSMLMHNNLRSSDSNNEKKLWLLGNKLTINTKFFSFLFLYMSFLFTMKTIIALRRFICFLLYNVTRI